MSRFVTKSADSKKGIKVAATKASGSIEYVLPLGNIWVVKNNSAKQFTVITDSKKEAIEIARELARNRNNELIVHGKSGKIEIHESYVTASIKRQKS